MSNRIGRVYFILALAVLCSSPIILGTQSHNRLLNLPEVVYVSPEGDPAKQALFLGIYLIGAVLLLTQVPVRQLFYLGMPLLLLLAWSLASITWSINPEATFRRLVALFGIVAIGTYAGLRFDLRESIRLLTFVAAVVLIASLVVALVIPSDGLDPEGRLRGVFYHKNVLSAFCVITLFTLFIRFVAKLDQDRATRAWLGLLFLVALFCLVLSKSAGPFPALIVAVFALAIVRAAQVSDGRFRAILPLVLTLAVLGAAVLVTLMGGAELLGKSSDLSGRTEVWEFAATMVERRPWLGYGYKVFWLGSDAPAAAFWKASRNFVPHAHNGFLELALDLGLIGLGLSVAAVISLAVKISRLLRHYPDICLFWVVGFISFDLFVNVGEPRLWEPNELHTLLFVYVVVRTNVEFASVSARARVIRTGLSGSPGSGSVAV